MLHRFQFLLVRLKEANKTYIVAARGTFQFLLVRLKELSCAKTKDEFRISIPSGAIKSPIRSARQLDYVSISIPSGAIKRIIGDKSGRNQ